jgi:hypothetical protein
VEQKTYGKPLFFSKLQMIPVKEEKPPEDLEQKQEDTGARKRRKE